MSQSDTLLGRRIAGGANRRPHRQSHTQKMPWLHASDRISDRGDGYFEPRRAGDDLVVSAPGGTI
jgi:hypothetical protein